MLHIPIVSHRQRRVYSEFTTGFQNGSLAVLKLSSSSRALLSDMKPFTDIFTFRSTLKNFLLAGVLATNPTIMEFNQFEIEQMKKPEDEQDDFDWNARIPGMYTGFQYNIVRLFSISFLRKVYESYAYYNLSTKMADKLTKDVFKSLMRKCERYRHKMDIVCQKIFQTSLYSSALTYLSLFHFDILEFHYKFFKNLYEEYYPTPTSPTFHTNPARRVISPPVPRKSLATNVITYLTELNKLAWKKLVYHACVWVSMAGGYGLGSYVNTKYGGWVGGSLAELLASGGLLALGL